MAQSNNKVSEINDAVRFLKENGCNDIEKYLFSTLRILHPEKRAEAKKC